MFYTTYSFVEKLTIVKTSGEKVNIFFEIRTYTVQELKVLKLLHCFLVSLFQILWS